MIIILILVVTGMVQGTQADSEKWVVKKLDSDLPLALYRSSTAWTGDKAYIFSGRDSSGHKISVLEFDPSSGVVTLKGATLPTGRIMATATYLGNYAYIFGGQDVENGILDEILRYDPNTDTVETMQTRLPEVRMGSSAVAVGESIYVIGGRNETLHVDTIFKFTPGNGTITTVGHMPVPGGGRVAVYDGKRVLLFGGCGTGDTPSYIHEFDPVTSQVRRLDVRMPSCIYWTTGIWTGKEVLIFGGNDFQVTLDEIVKYTPGEGDGTVEVVGKLPEPLELAVSCWDGSRAYVLGGRSVPDASAAIYSIAEAEKKPTNGPIPFATTSIMIMVLALSVSVNFRKRNL
jgi:N-acetylneuraminic acid mutarotase